MADAAMPAPARPYRFPAADPAWRVHLRERGYVVVGDVASAAEVAEAKAQIWADLEAAENIKRADPAGWYEGWRLPAHGLVASLAQSRGPWTVRGLPAVQNVFKQLWGTDDVITSMDAAILWRPWGWAAGNGEAMGRPPQTEGLHLDQNPFTQPDLACYQGMLPLIPVTPDVGGLQVVPYSHTDAAKALFKERHPRYQHLGDFCVLPGNSPCLKNPRPLLLEADAGDLILWDARTIHGGAVGPGDAWKNNPTPPADLARMAVTVAMVPRAWASADVQAARAEGFAEGRSFNHTPHEAGTSTGTIVRHRKEGYAEVTLSQTQRAVL